VTSINLVGSQEICPPRLENLRELKPEWLELENDKVSDYETRSATNIIKKLYEKAEGGGESLATSRIAQTNHRLSGFRAE
jgi:hypothetical protein